MSDQGKMKARRVGVQDIGIVAWIYLEQEVRMFEASAQFLGMSVRWCQPYAFVLAARWQEFGFLVATIGGVEFDQLDEVRRNAFAVSHTSACFWWLPQGRLFTAPKLGRVEGVVDMCMGALCRRKEGAWRGRKRP